MEPETDRDLPALRDHLEEKGLVQLQSPRSLEVEQIEHRVAPAQGHPVNQGVATRGPQVREEVRLRQMAARPPALPRDSVVGDRTVVDRDPFIALAKLLDGGHRVDDVVEVAQSDRLAVDCDRLARLVVDRDHHRQVRFGISLAGEAEVGPHLAEFVLPNKEDLGLPLLPRKRKGRETQGE